MHYYFMTYRSFTNSTISTSRRTGSNGIERSRLRVTKCVIIGPVDESTSGIKVIAERARRAFTSVIATKDRMQANYIHSDNSHMPLGY